MTHEWVLDVLTDLQSFAQSHDYKALAEHLEEAGLIAAAELDAHANGLEQPCSNDASANRSHLL